MGLLPRPSRARGRRQRRAGHLVLLVAVLTSALGLPAPAQAASLGCADNLTGITDLPGWAPSMLVATNAHRATLGLPALKLDATLTKASVWKARDLAQRGYFAHDDPASGSAPARSPWERLVACGYDAGGYRAENIAAGQDSGVEFIQAWINSPGHRANIEHTKMRYVGFGIVSSPGAPYHTYAVQMFGSEPGPVATEPVVDRTPQSGGEDTSGGGTAGATTSITSGATVTRVRCRMRIAVRGWCYRLTSVGRLASTPAGAAAARRVNVTRRTASGRFVLVGAATTRADGRFTLRRWIRPTATGTATWLARNARVVRAHAPATASATAATRTSLARIRL